MSRLSSAKRSLWFPFFRCMLQLVILLSLVITGIYTAFQQGNVLGWLRIICANFLDKILGKKLSRYVQKPLWDCLPCMGSVWTIVFTWHADVFTILAVCGLLTFADKLLAEKEEIVCNNVEGFQIYRNEQET